MASLTPRMWPGAVMLVRTAVVAFVAWVVACDDVVDPPHPVSVTISPSTVTMTALGATVPVRAEVRDQYGAVITGASLIWSSSDDSVATVSGDGLVTSAGNGMATVKVSVSGLSGSTSVTVAQEVSSLVVDPPLDTLGVGAKVQLSAEAMDSLNHPVVDVEFTWQSSEPKVAEVSTTGTIIARGLGSTEITATTGGIASRLLVTVIDNPDLAVLEAFYAATGGPTWSKDTNWLSDVPLIDWHGVQNINLKGRVTRLWLTNNSLSGPLPPELGDLASLEVLYLSDNALTGSIPLELGGLSNLKWLYLTNNELTGSMPPELGQLSHLERLNLGNNEIVGILPLEITQLEALEGFTFTGNAGLCAPGTTAFATWLGGVTDVRGPYCNEADVGVLGLLYDATSGGDWVHPDGWRESAAVGDWYGVDADSLGFVVAIDLMANGLSGQLPRELGDLATLKRLRVSDNTLSGPLPTTLSRLSLSELSYTGTSLCISDDASFLEWLAKIPVHQGTGIECARHPDLDALKALYESTNGDEWIDAANWLSSVPIEEWYGVDTDSAGRVTSLELAGNGLSGMLPRELGGLAHLEALDLYDNFLSGPLPPELGDLASLELLYLSNNALTGSIPLELGGLSNLKWLYLTNNELTGSLPPELGSLSNLEIMQAANNRLTGPIPPEFGNLFNLVFLYLNNNDLTGSLPPRLGRLLRLEDLDLGYNSLDGPIPSELGQLPKLSFLSAVRNNLTGPIPGELGKLQELERLHLSRNDLTGSIPRELGALASLTDLLLAGNVDLSGPLPLTLTGLPLDRLATGGTKLCAPEDSAFQDWLETIPDKWIAYCGTEASVYLTQAVQSRSLSVPLVAGERALLRVFVTAERQTSAVIPPVRARFFVAGRERHVMNIPAGSGAIPTQVDESELVLSANAEVPAEVIQPGLELVVEVDPDGTLDPQLGVVRRIPGTGRLAVEVKVVPTLDLTLIPFLWKEDPDQAVVDQVAGMSASPEEHPLLHETRTLLPVNGMVVTAHAPVISSSNLSFDLFAQTEAIRLMESASGHYMGMMSGTVYGAGGIANEPGKVSFSVPDAIIIAHELGHNMNLAHAPCGQPASVDLGFPYRDGSTGAWGYDFDGRQLVRPTEVSDLMSYCRPTWISDYHFARAIDFWVSDEADARSAVAGLALLLWGGIDAEGVPYLNPIFVTEAAAVLPPAGGDYRVIGRTARGTELFSFSFAMPELADADDAASFAFMVPAEAEWAGELASVSLTGPDGTATLDQESDSPMAIVLDPASSQVTAILRDVTEFADAFGATTRVLFSRGIPGVEAWR